MNNSNDVLAVAHRFIAALNVADVDAVRDVYSPDARIWHNFSGQLQSVEDNIKTMLWMHKKLSNVNYDIQRLEVIPGGFMQQHVLRGVLSSGEKFSMPACAICMVEKGRITSLEEYLDMTHTRPLSS